MWWALNSTGNVINSQYVFVVLTTIIIVIDLIDGTEWMIITYCCHYSYFSLLVWIGRKDLLKDQGSWFKKGFAFPEIPWWGWIFIFVGCKYNLWQKQSGRNLVNVLFRNNYSSWVLVQVILKVSGTLTMSSVGISAPQS